MTAKKKVPAKKRSPYENGMLPSKGGTCNHKSPCFKVVYSPPPENGMDTQHWFDEAGAVMSAMRQSRKQGIKATVWGPDGKLIVQFVKRSYDVAAAEHRLLDYNEAQTMHHELFKDVYAARAAQVAAQQKKHTKLLTKGNSEKKKPLAKKTASKPLRKKA